MCEWLVMGLSADFLGCYSLSATKQDIIWCLSCKLSPYVRDAAIYRSGLIGLGRIYPKIVFSLKVLREINIRSFLIVSILALEWLAYDILCQSLLYTSPTLNNSNDLKCDLIDVTTLKCLWLDIIHQPRPILWQDIHVPIRSRCTLTQFTDG